MNRFEAAKIIMNGKESIETEYGRKTVAGLADLLRGIEDGAICPCCGKAGVIARQDAFVNRKIGNDGKIDWDDESDVTTYDAVSYECSNCYETLELGDIEKKNGFVIK